MKYKSEKVPGLSFKEPQDVEKFNNKISEKLTKLFSIALGLNKKKVTKELFNKTYNSNKFSRKTTNALSKILGISPKNASDFIKDRKFIYRNLTSE